MAELVEVVVEVSTEVDVVVVVIEEAEVVSPGKKGNFRKQKRFRILTKLKN